MPEKPDGWKRDQKAKEAVLGNQGKPLAELRDDYEKAKDGLRSAMERHSPGATALESYREEVQRTQKAYEARRRGRGAGRLVKLTPEENRSWVKYFTWYMDEGFVEPEADESAWQDMQSEFPRLKEYDGVVPEQREETRTCEVCGLVLPMEEMTMLPGGEWICKRHPEVIKSERARALADLEAEAEGFFQKGLTGAQLMEAIMNAVEHVEREGYARFDSEEFAQAVMNALGPRGHTVRMGPHEGKWVVEVMIGMPLRWPGEFPKHDLARAFEEKGDRAKALKGEYLPVERTLAVAKKFREEEKSKPRDAQRLGGPECAPPDCPNCGEALILVDVKEIDTYAWKTSAKWWGKRGWYMNGSSPDTDITCPNCQFDITLLFPEGIEHYVKTSKEVID